MKSSTIPGLTLTLCLLALLLIGCSGSGGNQHIARFNQAIKASPDNAEAYANRGRAYLEMEEYARALADFRKSTELQPGSAPYQVLAARAYLGVKDYNSALSCVARARVFDVNLQDEYWTKGQVLQAMGQEDAALAQFDTAIGIDRKKIEPYLKRAQFYLQGQRFGDAQKDLSKAISLDSNNAAAYGLLGRDYAGLMKPDSSFAALARAVMLDSANPRYLSELARAYYDRKMKKNAVELYNRALAHQDRLSTTAVRGIKEALKKIEEQ